MRSSGSNNGSILPISWGKTCNGIVPRNVHCEIASWEQKVAVPLPWWNSRKNSLYKALFFTQSARFVIQGGKGGTPVPEWLFARPDTADSEIGNNAGPIEESLAGGGGGETSMYPWYAATESVAQDLSSSWLEIRDHTRIELNSLVVDVIQLKKTSQTKWWTKDQYLLKQWWGPGQRKVTSQKERISENRCTICRH